MPLRGFQCIHRWVSTNTGNFRTPLLFYQLPVSLPPIPGSSPQVSLSVHFRETESSIYHHVNCVAISLSLGIMFSELVPTAVEHHNLL